MSETHAQNTREITQLQDTVSEFFRRVETANDGDQAATSLKIVTNNTVAATDPYEATVIFKDEADFFLFSITKVASSVAAVS